MNVQRCDTDVRAHTAYIAYTHTPPPLSSSPVAMEPVAKAERYVVVMEVVDEGDDDDDDAHKDDNGERINSFTELQGPAGYKPMRCWALLSATWVEGATRNTAQCKQTLSSPSNKTQPWISIHALHVLPFKHLKSRQVEL